MPTVRTYGPPQVAPKGFSGQISPSAGGTAASEGAGVAEAQAQQFSTIAQLGQGAEKLGLSLYAQQQEAERKQLEDARQQAIQLNVIEGRNAIDAWKQTRIHDPQTGVLWTTHGKDAMPLPEQIDGEFQKVASDAMAGMATPEARLAFTKVVADQREIVGRTVGDHVGREIQTFTGNELKARVANGVDSAIRLGTTPDAQGRLDLRLAGREIAAVESDFRGQAPAIGLGPEQIAEQVQAIHTQVHEGIINQLVANGKPDAARVYFEQAKGDIDPQRMDDITKTLRAGGVRKESQLETERIITAGGTEEEQLAKARKIDDAEVQDEVVARLEHRHAVAKGQQQEAEKAASTDASNILDQTKGDLTAIDPTKWVRFSEPMKSALRSYADHLAKGEPVQTNIATYDVLERLATSPDAKQRQQFADMNLTQYQHLLSKPDLVRFLDVQGAIRKSDPDKFNALIATETTTRQIVDGNLVAIGVNPNPSPPGKPGYVKASSDAVLEYRRAVRDAVARREGITKKKLTEPEMQDIADTLMAQTAAAKTHWFSANEPAQITGGTFNVVTDVTGVPASERTQIENALRARHRPVTDDAIVALFNAHLRDVRGLKGQ
jgi:hypothetical protein